MELEVVVERDSFLAGLLDKGYANGDLELSPPGKLLSMMSTEWKDVTRTLSLRLQMEPCPRLQQASR